MKRILLWAGAGLSVAAAVAILLLCTCVFGNHTYRAATCTEPETCARCGKTRGEALGHNEAAATCEAPAICRRCGERRGDPLGHDFLPASCTAPETCARCGMTRGTALGHTFAPADCEAPETCLHCGITRGEALGHAWIPANFQTPATCARCGREDGEPLAPALAGSAWNGMQIGVPVPYATASYEDRDVSVTGTVEIADYTVIEGNADFPARAGYEWHVATVRIVFTGDDARKNGAQTAWTYGDFYILDDSMAARADENGLRPFAADWYGMRVQCWQKTGPYEEEDWFDRELRFTWQEGVLVPKGYDGVLLIFCPFTEPVLSAAEALESGAPVFRME